MKKQILLLCLLLAAVCTGCARDAALGVVGGADGPTAVIVGSAE